jgi:hypothetical protein
MKTCFHCNRTIERPIFDVDGKHIHLHCLKEHEAQKCTDTDKSRLG